MKFDDFPYNRPDIADAQTRFDQALQQLKQADSAQAAIDALGQIQTVQNELDTMHTLASIRNTIDTQDSFYEEETAFWDREAPIIQGWNTKYYDAVLGSPYRAQLEEALSPAFMAMAQNSLDTYDDSIVPLLQKENQLVTEYNKLIASAEIDYKGQTYNLSGLAPFTESADRQERKTVTDLRTQFFADNQSEFDRLYDEMVAVRHEMATQLGYKDYVEMAYKLMNRLDYNRQDVEVFRQQVLDLVVPLSQEIYQAQANRIGIDDLKHYDLAYEFDTGNPKPQGSPAEIVQAAVKMYHELSPETGEFIDFMVEHELMDLVTKPAKQSGGYCTYIPNFNSPFIFSNFNGTSGDVDVLTHEAGHAFQVYQSRWVTAPELIWPTYESCEIHSMSMEFITWPWMESFFGEEADKYKYQHLAGCVSFLPYGVLVDHFQHEVYENPEMTPAERRAKWRELEQMYNPWKDYDDSDFLEAGGFWFRQGHIFSSPFYYIDYTLAQVCAFQFWKRTQVDHDDAAWSDYLAICRVGGTKTFLELVDLAGLESPFKAGSLAVTMQAIEEYIKQSAFYQI